jgi:C-terminal processing protease CtpA/Prc
MVAEVYPGTPADAAGLKVADEIKSLNGRAINHDLDWQVGLVDAGVGNSVEVTYRRGEREQQTQLLIEEIPSGQATLVEVLSGLGLVTVTEQIIQERSLEVEFGALIVSIEEEVQRVTRLRLGDVIWGINENEVRSAEEASEFFDYYAQSGETQGWVRVHIARGKQSGALTFRVG